MATLASTPGHEASTELRRLWWAGPLTIAVAVLANTLVFTAAEASEVFPAGVIIPAMGAPLTLAPVLFSTAVGVLGGVLALALLGRFSRRPLPRYRAIALVALVLSFATPFSVPGAPAGFYVTLLLLHLIAGMIAIWLPSRLVRADSATAAR